MSETVERFRALQQEELEIFMRKNADYGDSFREEGILGAMVRMKDKLNRFITLARKTGEEAACKDEPIRDTLIDLANYSKLAVIAHEGGEPYGDPPGTKTVELVIGPVAIDPVVFAEKIAEHISKYDTVRFIMRREESETPAPTPGDIAPIEKDKEDKTPPIMMYPDVDGF